jgi:tetratricopeptide (TPR) repeat protein
MTKIALRAYNHEIESMIEQGQRLDEAVAHCRHILTSYPKHLDTYRLLGKAYLEAKRYDQAVDIFQRVLVAAPDDFVSHVGMSIIADDQGKLDEAIWDMERAFEVQPSNAAIQAELQRLFGRRDGTEPAKIRLTRGALAHMYVQGELYTQAISEIRAVLEHDPERRDMQVLLALAYFRNGQKAESADICSALLAISPYCLDANRLMAEILPGTQAAEAGQEHRRRVLDLDPYAEYTRGSFFASDAVPDGSVTLQRLEYTGQGLEERGAISMGLTSGSQGQAPLGSLPSWLSPGVVPAATMKTPTEQDREKEKDLPQFLKGSGWRQAPAPAADGPSAFEAAPEAESESENEVVAGELPEWVRALAPNDEHEAAASSTSSPASTISGLSRDGWQPLGSASPAANGSSEAGATQDTPDWLRELANGGGASLNAVSPPPDRNAEPDQEVPRPTPIASTGSDDGMAWLEGLAEKHGAKPEELITPREARTANPTEWIDKLGQEEESAPEGWMPIAEGPHDSESTDTGMAAPPESSTVAAGASMDWLSELASSDAFAGMERPAENDPAPISGDEARWGESPPSSDSGLPDWLAEKPAEPPAPDPAAAREASGEYESKVDLPDWLADLDGAKESAVTAATAGATPTMPEWLGPSSEPTESIPEPAPPRPLAADGVPEQIPAAIRPESAPSQSLVAPSHQERAAPPTREAPPARPRTRPQVSATDSASLGAAKTELNRGNIAAALEIYGRLIRKGKSLTEIVRELREALYRYPVEVPIWQALGDAYMRADRLQEALDAYTKAEELLR